MILSNIYKDEGCEISHKCVTCPLSQCRHDDEHLFNKYRSFATHVDVLYDLNDTNEPAASISKKHKTHIRTVYRLQKLLNKGLIDVPTVQIFSEKGLAYPKRPDATI